MILKTTRNKCAAHVVYSFSFVWFLLHLIYVVFHILLSGQSSINHKETGVCCFKYSEVFCSKRFRGGSRAAATSKIECFVITVNGFQPLTIITKHSILDVASALDPLLQLVLHSWQLNFLVLVAGPLFILIGHMIILFFFLNVIKMYMSTVSFLVHLEFFACLQNGFVWSMI